MLAIFIFMIIIRWCLIKGRVLLIIFSLSIMSCAGSKFAVRQDELEKLSKGGPYSNLQYKKWR